MAVLYNSISNVPVGSHIRLLTLLPSYNFEGEVCGQLTMFSLDECPKSEALSYVWGDVTVGLQSSAMESTSPSQNTSFSTQTSSVEGRSPRPLGRYNLYQSGRLIRARDPGQHNGTYLRIS